jgi:hypothetical protein
VTLSDRRTQRSWSVELAPYQLAAFPVTQALYAQITGQSTCSLRVRLAGVKTWLRRLPADAGSSLGR